MLTIFIILVVVIEFYYWFVYFPKAWRNETNQEINNIKNSTKFMQRFYKGE
jgi:hypothetical protein